MSEEGDAPALQMSPRRLRSGRDISSNNTNDWGEENNDLSVAYSQEQQRQECQEAAPVASSSSHSNSAGAEPVKAVFQITTSTGSRKAKIHVPALFPDRAEFVRRIALHGGMLEATIPRADFLIVDKSSQSKKSFNDVLDQASRQAEVVTGRWIDDCISNGEVLVNFNEYRNPFGEGSEEDVESSSGNGTKPRRLIRCVVGFLSASNVKGQLINADHSPS